MAEPVIKTNLQNYNVGMRFCIALSKGASNGGENVGIRQAASSLIMSSDYEVWVKAAHLAANCYQESQGLEPLTEKQYLDIADKMGFKAMAELIALMWESFEALNTKGLEEVDSEKKN